MCLVGRIKCHWLARPGDRRGQVRGALTLKIPGGRRRQTRRPASRQTGRQAVGGRAVIDGEVPTFISILWAIRAVSHPCRLETEISRQQLEAFLCVGGPSYPPPQKRIYTATAASPHLFWSEGLRY